MATTTNLVLPYIVAAQAQKHVTHNEALRSLDAIVQLSVLDRDLTAPPGAPVEGARYLVAASPAGGWSGHAGHVAAWQDGAWAFFVPKDGWLAWVADESALYVFHGAAWTFFSAGSLSVNPTPLLGVNATADTTNRLSVASPASLFNHEGAGHQQKINKATAADTASVLFQTNFSGRAEMGLAGDDDYHFKVSPDGSAWREAILIDRTLGRVSFPYTAQLATPDMMVNPGMEVSQANGASAVTLTASGSLQTAYTVDGVMAAYRGSFVAAAQQVVDAPPGYAKSLKFTVSTAQSSLGSNDELSVLIPIEGVRTARLALGTANAAVFCYSFWAKAHRTGTYSGSVRNSAKNRSRPFTFTISAADTWEYKTVYVTAGDTSGTWLADTGVGTYLNICIAGGSSRVGTADAWAGADYSGATGTTNGVAATSDIFQVTGVMALPGLALPVAAEAWRFQRLLPDAELDCKRYLDILAPGATDQIVTFGNVSSSTTCFFVIPTSRRMRVAPTMSVSDPAHWKMSNNTEAHVGTAAGFLTILPDRGTYQLTTSGIAAAGNTICFLMSADAAARIIASARF